jgi:alpha-beta hydrolase superfamily lysophospholipase
MRTIPMLRSTIAAAALGLMAVSAASPAAAPPPRAPDPGAQAVMASPAPPVLRYRARDGALLAYRAFAPDAAQPAVVAILMHGSGGSSLNMTVLGEALARAGVAAFAPDARGQGLSGRRGDIDYIGQQDDDLADFVAVVRRAYPNARLALVGHSAGGGFVLRIAGEAEGRLFSRFVLLSPVLGRLAAVNRPDAGWARPNMPLIAVLAGLNQIGVTAFNGARAVSFNLAPGAEALGMTGSWSYRMMSNYGPRGQTQLFGRPAYWLDAAKAPAPIVVVAGAADEQFYADRYAAAFAGLPVSVTLAPGVSHMGVVSDPRAAPLVVEAVKAAAADQ